MTRLCLFIALIIQNSFVFSIELTLEKNDGDLQTIGYENDSLDDLRNKPKTALDADAKEDFFNTFFAQNSHIYPSSSVAMMNQVQNSEKPPAEQLEDIKSMASKITMSIQSELANLLSFAINGYEKISEGKEDRTKRSAESPLDSAQLISRLLKHIKSNNEYQNIAIDKMMSAKEIADKYNIDFKPDPEILTDFAEASNKNAQELNEILTDVCEARNASIEHSFVPLDGSSNVSESYYHYDVQPEGQYPADQGFVPFEEYVPQEIQRPVNPHHQHHHHHQHFETQVLPPPVQQHHYCTPPVSQRPNVFEPQVPFTPAPQYYPAFEPLPVVIFEEIYEPEPVMVGEEYEETVSSKVVVEQGDEPGSSTVNHVMTYTLSEKAHYRKPQIERLPEQVQYYFLMM